MSSDQGSRRKVQACFSPERSWNRCISENNLSLPYQQKGRGYDFGWGALEQTKDMCRYVGPRGVYCSSVRAYRALIGPHVSLNNYR